MKLRHAAVLALAAATLVGCKKKRPADGPTNTPVATADPTDLAVQPAAA